MSELEITISISLQNERLRPPQNQEPSALFQVEKQLCASHRGINRNNGIKSSILNKPEDLA